MDFREIANPAAFHDNPYLAWSFYGHRLKLYRDTRPHPGFRDIRADLKIDEQSGIAA